MEANEITVEKVMGKLGDWGRYQRFQFLLQVISAIPTGIHMISLVTVAAVPEHRCSINEIDTMNHTESWSSSKILDAIPMNSQGKLDSCKMYDENKSIVDCNSWVYDNQYFTSSRGIEWDFVCAQKWMGALPQTVFMLGVVMGSLILGPCCDIFGRKSVYVWAATFQLLFGVSVAFTSEYYTFVAVRFLYGIFAISPFKAGYVLFIELIGPSKRTACASMFQILFGVGVALIGVWGYLIDNRFYLQIVYGLHTLLLMPQWFLLDESPRWLMSKGRVTEALAIVENALRINKSNEKLNTPLLLSSFLTINDGCDENQSAGIIDLFKTRNMLKKSIIMCGCWFAVSVVYYGLSMNAGKLSGNPYLMLVVSGLVELPGYILAMFLVTKFGHRAILSSTMMLSGMSLLLVIALPNKSTASTCLVMLGKMIISGSFAVIYKYGSELFPTVVRSSAVGFGTMCASVAAALTPLISLLDSFNPMIPTIVIGFTSLFFGICSLFLPETLGRHLPQTLADGENFGIGDTCFVSCRNRRISTSSADSLESDEPIRVIVNIRK